MKAGFEVVEIDNASRSHRVFVARKPLPAAFGTQV